MGQEKDKKEPSGLIDCVLHDGQHRHGELPERQCFFCFQPTRHYLLFSYPPDPDKPPAYNKYADPQKFVLCPVCAKKGHDTKNDYLAQVIAQYIAVQEFNERIR